MKELSHEETLDIITRAHAALGHNDEIECKRLIKQIPLAPHLAKAAKEIWGKEFLLQEGYDLSEAEARYGKNWIDQ